MTHVPQEYPKMVPGPDGPTVVQDEKEELGVLGARVKALSCPNLPAEATVLVARPQGVGVSEFDVDAWVKARRASQHDWIAALHRPYVPVA